MSCKTCGKTSLFQQAVNIAKGTYNAIFPNEETRAIAEPRLKICVLCIYSIELVKINGVATHRCKECNCIVQSKATVKEEKCPKEFW